MWEEQSIRIFNDPRRFWYAAKALGSAGLGCIDLGQVTDLWASVFSTENGNKTSTSLFHYVETVLYRAWHSAQTSLSVKWHWELGGSGGAPVRCRPSQQPRAIQSALALGTQGCLHLAVLVPASLWIQLWAWPTVSQLLRIGQGGHSCQQLF